MNTVPLAVVLLCLAVSAQSVNGLASHVNPFIDLSFRPQRGRAVHKF